MNSSETREFFHSPQDGREVLFIAVCQLICIDAKRRLCHRHQDMLLCRRIQNQLKVLVHQAQWKLWTVIVRRYPCQLSHMSRSDDGCLCQDFQQTLAIETSFLPQHNSLSNGLHAHTQQRVDDQLHNSSRPGTAQKMKLFCDRLKYWLGGAEEFPVAAYQ